MDENLSSEDLEISDFDVVDYLGSTEEIATYLTIVFETLPSGEIYLRHVLMTALRAGISLSDDATELELLLRKVEGRDEVISASQLFSTITALGLQASFTAK